MKKKQRKAETALPPQPTNRYPLLFGAFIYLIVFVVMNVTNNRFGFIADFFFHVPTLIANRIYLFKNGPFELPYYTPALGGGIPAYGDPQDMYFSLTQLVFLIFSDQKLAITAAFSVTLFMYHVGFFAFLRHFGVSRWLANWGALVFALNGFVTSRWSVGHLGIQVYWSVPLIIMNVHKIYLRPAWVDVLRSCVWIGGLMALCVYGTDIHSIYFTGILVFTFLLCFGLMEMRIKDALVAVALVVFVAGPFTVLFSLSKDMAVMAYLRQFGRETGNNIMSLRSILWMVPNAVFNPLIDVSSKMPYKDVSDWHEDCAYVGITLGIFLLIGLVTWFRKRAELEEDWKKKSAAFLVWMTVTYVWVGYLLLGDNAFWRAVKDFPVISAYHQLSRFTAVFPVVTIGMAFLLFERLRRSEKFGKLAYIAAVICFLDVVIYGATIDTSAHKGIFPEHKFPRTDGVKVERWEPSSSGVGMIQNVGDPCALNPQFRPTGRTCANLDPRASPLAVFPDGTFNVNDPSAMIYSQEVGRPVWSRLPVKGNEEKVVRFLNYENPDFFIPERQKWANRISLLSWVLGLSFLWITKRKSEQPGTPAGSPS